MAFAGVPTNTCDIVARSTPTIRGETGALSLTVERPAERDIHFNGEKSKALK